VHRSIKLDREPLAHDCEIRNVFADRMLSSHVNAFGAE
jgi:hypothetical protein